MIREFLEKNFPQYLPNYFEDKNLLMVWDWSYQDYLTFLQSFTQSVLEDNQIGLNIVCSHPHCFTNGTGLQKGNDPSVKELIPFDQNTALSFPLHQIKRGGGLTFHYPGQIILYPIYHMNFLKSSPSKIMVFLLKTVKEIFETKLALENLDYKNKLLGLWHEGRKIASLGMGLERYVSQHGMAINFFNDQEMFQTLAKINPCGLKSETYQTVENLLQNKVDSKVKTEIAIETFEKFNSYFLSKKNVRQLPTL